MENSVIIMCPLVVLTFYLFIFFQRGIKKASFINLPKSFHLFNMQSLIIRCCASWSGCRHGKQPDNYHVDGPVGEIGKGASNYNELMSSQGFTEGCYGKPRGFPEECTQ